MNRQEKLEWLARNEDVWPHYAVCATTDGVAASYSVSFANIVGDNAWITRKEWLDMREELQNKPSWKDAPEWANWLGQCYDGEWEWYGDEDAPAVNEEYQYFDHMSEGDEAGFKGEVLGDWRDTLDRRPESETKTGPNEMTITTQDNSWHERGELPPVGTVCEVKTKTFKGWMKCFVVGKSSRGDTVIECDDCAFIIDSTYEFRPLRPERENAIDAACEAIGGVGEDDLLVIEKLYDAGMLKQ